MIRERLGKELLYFDGGMGTLLQARDFSRESYRRHGMLHMRMKSKTFTNNIFQQEVILYLRIHLERMH